MQMCLCVMQYNMQYSQCNGYSINIKYNVLMIQLLLAILFW